MNIKKNLIFKILPILVIAFLMCYLKLWFSMFVFIIPAMLITFFTGKRSFCNGYCPLGNIQDLVYDKTKTSRKFTNRIIIKIIITTAFWIYIALCFLFFRSNTLWILFFRLMLSIFSVALIMQILFSKRVWCAKICPIGNTMSLSLKIRRKIIDIFASIV